MRSRAVAWALGLAVLLQAACASFDPEKAARWPTPRRGMVVCEHPLAAEAGKYALREDGNAADAAVAAALALAVVYPQAGNLGGGGFAVWVAHDPNQAPWVLDFRETAPRGLTPEHFLDEEGRLVPERSLSGPLGVGVPGSPRGLFELHKALGRLPFSKVATPAIDLAEAGFPVDAWLARDLADPDTREFLTRDPYAASIFYPGGEPLGEGELLVQSDLAKTLRRLVSRGPRGFYEGEVADAIVDTLRAGGGVMDQEDLEAYETVRREPLRGWFRGLEIVTVPPPSSGGLVLLQALSMLDGFPLDKEIARARTTAREMGRETDAGAATLSARAVHWWIEAMRLAFADRARHMGDPAYHDVPVDELLSPEWIAERRVSIGESANPEAEPLDLGAFHGGEDTTHLSVLDRDGNAVSLTTTLNTSFGSGMMARGAGFFLNNELDDFALQADTPNVYGLVGGSANALEPGEATAVVDDADRGPRRRPGRAHGAGQPGGAADHHVGPPGHPPDRGLRPVARGRGRRAARAPAVEPARHARRARVGPRAPAGTRGPPPRARARPRPVGERPGDPHRGRRRAHGGQRPPPRGRRGSRGPRDDDPHAPLTPERCQNAPYGVRHFPPASLLAR